MTDRPKRPRDANQLAKLIADIATGEEKDTKKPAKSAAAAELGRVGGRRRAEKLSPEQRKQIAQKAAAKRWAKTAAPSEEE